jgi:immune inhibitor A
MKTRLFSILGVVIMLVAAAGVAPVQAAPKLPDYEPADLGPSIREMPPTQDQINMDIGALAKKIKDAQETIEVSDLADCITSEKIFMALDDYYGGYFFDVFYLVAEDENAQIWVQANLGWLDGDPRPTPVITCEQADYMLAEFSNNILPTESEYFGPADFLDGSASLLEAWGYFDPGYYYDETGRQVILIENVEDENYYDPTYPLYIAGFYSSSLEAYFGRNTMTIDAYDWINRVGPDVNRPYLYEGTFAHEYQHLLQDDYDPAEENWINEGLSGFAQELCGYGVPIDDAEAFAEMPENSLVAWGDQGGLEMLADYGNTYLFQELLYQQYGEEYIHAEFQDGAHQGIESVNYVLGALGESETFADIYHEFALGLYTGGLYEGVLSTLQVDVGHPGKPNPDAYASPGAPPWGTDYILLWGYEQIANFKFNGYEFNPTPWTSDGEVLWGGKADLLDNFLIFETEGGGTLTFDTMYVIEDMWDFGFVQVSLDGGYTWTSLENEYTSSDYDLNAHPNIIVNMPGLTGTTDGEWVTMSFDLSAYPGQDILVAFRYMTDWGYTEAGWFIDNVYVDDTLISDGSSTDAFKSINEVKGIQNNFRVTLLGQRNRKGTTEYSDPMVIMDGGYQMEEWSSIREMFDNYTQVLMLVTNTAEEDLLNYAPYSYEVDHRGGIHIKK